MHWPALRLSGLWPLFIWSYVSGGVWDSNRHTHWRSNPGEPKFQGMVGLDPFLKPFLRSVRLLLYRSSGAGCGMESKSSLLDTIVMVRVWYL